MSSKIFSNYSFAYAGCKYLLLTQVLERVKNILKVETSSEKNECVWNFYEITVSFGERGENFDSTSKRAQ